ncbi:MAG: hypothetical protein PVJ26_12150 [Anaerolineae bacterium]
MPWRSPTGTTTATMRLPDGGPDLEIMRHLGQPLEPIDLDPTGPVVFQPLDPGP